MLRTFGFLAITSTLAVAGPVPADPTVIPTADPRSERAPSVSGRPLEAVLDRSHEIDRMIEEDLARRGLAPNPTVDDEIFLRRTFLGIVGRIPSIGESQAFLRDHSRDKRHELIDRLLDSPGHESHMFHWFADLLRARTKLARYTSGEPYLHYIKESIATNRPYDEFVRDLLTAEGPAHERGNGATGYVLRDRGMPEDNLANTVRVFLGTRVECAQCHDHPFDDWTQREFFEMVAFSGGVDYRHDEEPMGRLNEMRVELKRAGSDAAYRAFRRILRPTSSGVSGSGTGIAQLPDDYQYEDALPGAYVRADALFGPSPEMPDLAAQATLDRMFERSKSKRAKRKKKNKKLKAIGPSRAPEIGSRDAFASWLSAPDNERFTTVIANRMCRRVMGVGLIEPVDDLKADTAAFVPPLMDRLERLMLEVDYDLRQFQRVLFHTELWQREAASLDPTEPQGVAFTGPSIRRMSAEQIWDSLLALVVPNVDDTLEAPGAGAELVYDRFESARDMSDADLEQWTKTESLRYTDKKKYKRKRIKSMAEDRRDEIAAKKLVKKLRRAQDRGRDDLAARLRDKIGELGLPEAEIEQAMRGKGLERASDLESPVDPGHFLWQFGQSEREQIEASNTAANVPQVLNLLNGFVEDEILSRRNAVVLEALAEESSSRDKIDTAWLAVLGRQPSSSERKLWGRDIDRDGTTAVHDLLWTLINSHEFLFIR